MESVAGWVSYAIARSTEEQLLNRVGQFSFRCGTRVHEKQREFVQWIVQGHEALYRASNQNGKTWVGAALAVALARGDTHLGDVELPFFGHPTVGWVLSQSWRGQVDAAQAAVLYWIGNAPHRVAFMNAGLGYVGVVYVKSRFNGGDDWRKWSRIVFHVEGEGKGLPGGRIDYAWADEPPTMKRWQEVRGRGRAEGMFLRWLTVTPIERERWEPLKRDFGDCLGRPKEGRVEVRASIYDNPWLSPAHIQGLLDGWRNDEHLASRIWGDYVDTSGDSPFRGQYEVLRQWEKECRVGTMRSALVRARIETPHGRQLVEKRITYEWWFPPELDEEYFGVLDTSLGIKDNQGVHDPGCCHIYGRRKRRLVARFNGYESSYNLGSIAAAMGRQYRDAMIAVDMTGGYGDAAQDALADCEYWNLSSEIYRDRNGQMSTRIGFVMSENTKHMYIGEIQKMLENQTLLIPSAGVLGCLTNARLDEKGRLHKPLGVKYEDLVCLGQFLMWDSQVPVQPIIPKAASTFETAVNEAFGHDVFEDSAEMGGLIHYPPREEAVWDGR